MGNLDGIDGSQPYLFVAVDEVTEYATAVDIGDNMFTQLFTGSDPWGAAIIPSAVPGGAVVFFVSGTELWRWQSGAPVLCCSMTYQGANQSMVSAAYNPSAEQLLMTKNTATEAVYSLLVPGGVCPAIYDIAGAAFDPPLTNPWTTSEVFSAGAYGAGLIPVELQSLTIE